MNEEQEGRRRRDGGDDWLASVHEDAAKARHDDDIGDNDDGFLTAYHGDLS